MITFISSDKNAKLTYNIKTRSHLLVEMARLRLCEIPRFGGIVKGIISINNLGNAVKSAEMAEVVKAHV